MLFITAVEILSTDKWENNYIQQKNPAISRISLPWNMFDGQIHRDEKQVVITAWEAKGVSSFGKCWANGVSLR